MNGDNNQMLKIKFNARVIEDDKKKKLFLLKQQFRNKENSIYLKNFHEDENGE